MSSPTGVPNSEERSHLKVSKGDSVSVVHFVDRRILEELLISEIGEELADLVSDQRGIRLLLSFKGVEHLSSAALGMLITLKKRVTEQSGTIKLSDITPQIYEVFKITRLNKMFEIHDTTAQALAAF